MQAERGPDRMPDLVGYLWNCLGEDEHRRVAEEVAADPRLQAELESLRRRLEPLEWDREADAAPAGLAVETLARVAEFACRDRKLPAAPPVTRPAGVERPWRRRIDVAVAASVILTSLALLLPTIMAGREQMQRLACQNNLQVVWKGIKGYETQHHKLPDPGSTARPVAGMIAPLLRDAGQMKEGLPVCPGTKQPIPVGLTVADLEKLPADAFDQLAPQLLPGYAYSLGFRDADGGLHPVDDMVREIKPEHLPIIGDAPAVPVSTGNSPNHTGNGQNLLFMDGHAGFVTTRMLGDAKSDDIYLNRKNRTEAGVDAADIVLGQSGTRP